MFNYYSHLKKSKEQEDFIKNESRNKKLQEKRKKDMDRYIEGYENRIKGFIFQMAASPIKIKDHKNKIYSSRKELLDEENDKIIGTKGFVFKKFKTERQRLEELMKERETIYIKDNMLQLALAERRIASEMSQSGSSSKRDLNKSNSNDVGAYNNIIQPTMRFKARTDLERIFDAINKNNFGRVDRELLDKQLKNLELNVSKKVVRDDDEDLEEEVLDYWTPAVKRRQRQLEIDRMREEKQKLLEEKGKKRKARRRVDNSISRQFMSDLHLKTHFKGATGYTLFKNTTVPHQTVYTSRGSNHNVGILNTSINFTNNNTLYNNTVGNNTMMNTLNTESTVYNNTYSNSDRELYNTINSNNKFKKGPSKSVHFSNNHSKTGLTHKQSNNGQEFREFHDSELSYEVLQNNPLLYNINNNPFKKKSEHFDFDQHKLNYIKTLAFTNPNEEDALQTSPKAGYKNTGFFKKLRSKKKIQNHPVINPINQITSSSRSLNRTRTFDENENILKNNPVNFFVRFGEHPEIDLKKVEEEKIMIDGEMFMKNDIDKIAKKVLTGCNFSHMKNKNNPTSHKAGSGKLMITNGMTLNEFTKKYKLK